MDTKYYWQNVISKEEVTKWTNFEHRWGGGAEVFFGGGGGATDVFFLLRKVGNYPDGIPNIYKKI